MHLQQGIAFASDSGTITFITFVFYMKYFIRLVCEEENSVETKKREGGTEIEMGKRKGEICLSV